MFICLIFHKFILRLSFKAASFKITKESIFLITFFEFLNRNLEPKRCKCKCFLTNENYSDQPVNQFGFESRELSSCY